MHEKTLEACISDNQKEIRAIDEDKCMLYFCAVTVCAYTREVHCRYENISCSTSDHMQQFIHIIHLRYQIELSRQHYTVSTTELIAVLCIEM